MVEYVGSKTTAGVSLGQSAADLVALHGSTPVAQASAITLTSGTLGTTNTAVNSILTALRNKGIIASA